MPKDSWPWLFEALQEGIKDRKKWLGAEGEGAEQGGLMSMKGAEKGRPREKSKLNENSICSWAPLRRVLLCMH